MYYIIENTFQKNATTTINIDIAFFKEHFLLIKSTKILTTIM